MKTLNETLKELNYTSKTSEISGKKDVYDNKGKFLGSMTASQCWYYFHENKLI